MKIAVCVKHVPAGRVRMHPDTLRIERSGPGELNAFDKHAIEAALRIAEGADGAETVVVSVGPPDAEESLRTALAMGADRAVLVSDDAAASVRPGRHGQAARRGARARGARPRRCSASRRATAAARCSGPRSPSSCGQPFVSQASTLDLRDGAVVVSRETEYGNDVIEAPLPALVAVSDAINEPRYTSLKGLMAAKKKPLEVLSVADLGVDAGGVGAAGAKTEVLAIAAAALARHHGHHRRRSRCARGDRRVPRRAGARVKALVFLEHHEGVLSRGFARRAREGGRARPVESPRSSSGAGRSPTSPPRRARYGATTVHVAEGDEFEPPLPQPRVDVLEAVVRDGGYDTVLFSNSVLAADVAAALAARLDAGLNWDLIDLQRARRHPRRPAPGAAGLRVPRRRLACRATPRAVPPRLVRGGRDGRRPRASRPSPRRCGRTRRPRSSRAQEHRRSEGPSIEDAEVVVAGGLGLGLGRGVLARRGPRGGARRRGRRDARRRLQGLVSRTPRRSARPARPSRPSCTSRSASPARCSTRSGCRTRRSIVAINKDPNAPIFEFSDLAVVGDVHAIVPRLVELLRAAQGQP